MIRNDLLLQFVGRAECSIRSLCTKINFLLIFGDKFCSFIGECYGFNPLQSKLYLRFPISALPETDEFPPEGAEADEDSQVDH